MIRPMLAHAAVWPGRSTVPRRRLRHRGQRRPDLIAGVHTEYRTIPRSPRVMSRARALVGAVRMIGGTGHLGPGSGGAAAPPPPSALTTAAQPHAGDDFEVHASTPAVHRPQTSAASALQLLGRRRGQAGDEAHSPIRHDHCCPRQSTAFEVTWLSLDPHENKATFAVLTTHPGGARTRNSHRDDEDLRRVDGPRVATRPRRSPAAAPRSPAATGSHLLATRPARPSATCPTPIPSAPRAPRPQLALLRTPPCAAVSPPPSRPKRSWAPRHVVSKTLVSNP